MSNNSFGNNSAQYGADIASIPYKIVEQNTMNDQIYLNNVPSGLRHDSSIKLMLVDMEGQVMNLENEASVKIRTNMSVSRISGSNSDTQVDNTAMYVSFRYCQPGEIVINNQCSK